MDKQKKQTAIMGVLLLVLVAVGAFQFMGPKPAAPATETAASESDSGTTPTTGSAIEAGSGDQVATIQGEGAETSIDPMASTPLAVRDPFLPTGMAQAAAKDNAEAGQKTAAPVSPPVVQANPQTVSRPNASIGGNVPFVNPFPNEHPSGLGQLPQVGSMSGGPSAGPNIEPAKRSGYKVVGTIVGKQKMVVLEDPDGNQVLVPEGKKTPDGKARVVGVQKGKAKVSQEGQVKMLGLEEE